MRKWRVLSCAVLACIICLQVCGVAYGAEWTSIEDMGIDPWSDLDKITGAIPLDQDLDQDDNSTYAVASDIDILPLALPGSSGTYRFSIFYGSDYTRSIQFYCPGGQYYGNHVAQLTNGQLTAFGTDTSQYDNDNAEGYLTFWPGAYYTITMPVSVLTDNVSKVYLNGSIRSYPEIVIQSGSTTTYRSINSAYFNCQLLVNGEVYGDPQEGMNLNLSNYEIDLSVTGNISSIGYKVYFLGSKAVVGPGQGSFVPYKTCEYGWVLHDDLELITQGGGGSSGGVDEETKGILRTILDGILALPGNIAGAVLDGLKALFLPSQDELIQLRSKYEALLSERLGFVWQAGERLTTYLLSFLDALRNSSEYTFDFPGISVDLPEGTFVIVPAQTVDLDNAVMTTLRSALGTIVSFVCVVAFVNICEDMVVGIISGASYFEYLKGGKGDAD